ncbi:hypothetical protein F5Y15DRAFT_401092, partial [Xylariaceae sp. FL0016]
METDEIDYDNMESQVPQDQSASFVSAQQAPQPPSPTAARREEWVRNVTLRPRTAQEERNGIVRRAMGEQGTSRLEPLVLPGETNPNLLAVSTRPTTLLNEGENKRIYHNGRMAGVSDRKDPFNLNKAVVHRDNQFAYAQVQGARLSETTESPRQAMGIKDNDSAFVSLTPVPDRHVLMQASMSLREQERRALGRPSRGQVGQGEGRTEGEGEGSRRWGRDYGPREYRSDHGDRGGRGGRGDRGGRRRHQYHRGFRGNGSRARYHGRHPRGQNYGHQPRHEPTQEELAEIRRRMDAANSSTGTGNIDERAISSRADGSMMHEA